MAFKPRKIRTADGSCYEVNIDVLPTNFAACTGRLANISRIGCFAKPPTRD
ncbi:hypothetical protein BJY01DRAFT_106 [Aspergillus pseudoustus]|uniref:PilZ domain-containing protein n=1 Tax=Aspergillus pseudoustus TaxID=1810923 RepID=A0ABR4L1R4_9EURO